jgi:hypothetical protein
MSDHSKQYKNKLNFIKFFSLLWEYLNQPLLEPDYTPIFDLQKFNQYFHDIQFLEYCWELEFQPDPPQSGIR